MAWNHQGTSSVPRRRERPQRSGGATEVLTVGSAGYNDAPVSAREKKDGKQKVGDDCITDWLRHDDGNRCCSPGAVLSRQDDPHRRRLHGRRWLRPVFAPPCPAPATSPPGQSD